MTAPRGCTEPPVVAGGGDTLLVPSETYPTIQSAVDAAAPGDVVFVNAGTYHESVHLRSNVSLVGAGVPTTIIDGDGDATSLIDYTDAKNAVVSGFTLAGVGRATGCADRDDVFACSGNWYAAAIYGDGHWDGSGDPVGTICARRPSVLVTHNIIRGNVIGMMAYFHARAVVANNISLATSTRSCATHLGQRSRDADGFYDNQSFVGSLRRVSRHRRTRLRPRKYGLGAQISQNRRYLARLSASSDDWRPGARHEQGTLTSPAFVDAANGYFSPTP